LFVDSNNPCGAGLAAGRGYVQFVAQFDAAGTAEVAVILPFNENHAIRIRRPGEQVSHINYSITKTPRSGKGIKTTAKSAKKFYFIVRVFSVFRG
jgi:hypothetical protein